MISNDYSKLKIIDSVFNLALVIDQILAYRFLAGVTGPRRNMANSVYELARYLTLTSSGDVHSFLGKVDPNINDPLSSPDAIIPRFLDGSARFDGRAIDLSHFIANRWNRSDSYLECC
jgi:hypothetical protein